MNTQIQEASVQAFTREDVIQYAQSRYRKALCLDQLQDALQQPTVEDGANVLLMDSAMWDSDNGDPFDETNLIPESEITQ